MRGDMTPREIRIRERAKQLWEEAGKPEHRDEEFWVQAEREIEAEDQPKR